MIGRRGTTPIEMTIGRRGTTLIELLVVLVILGIMAGVVGLAAGSLGGEAEEPGPGAQIAAARSQALRTRRPVALSVMMNDTARFLLALPDGSVRADSALGLDPLTGRPRAAR
ncbi:prepilin-type N-terminal cleavage/methylation domain-containing protein [Longimicrobium terrae]|nr:prepilin-type N-terminal cleavage/methylation domain-containing protein [Longimicrobium terrae]